MALKQKDEADTEESLQSSSSASVDEGDKESESQEQSPPVPSKRAAAEIKENGGDRELKKAKNNNSGEESSRKTKSQRVFNKDDELVILEGLVDYKDETGVYGGSKIKDFHSFIIKSLAIQVNSIQLYEKIRRLRKRYEKYSNSGHTVFETRREQEAFDLSKKIWGSDQLDNGNVKVKTEGGKKYEHLTCRLPNVSMSAEELVMNHGLDIIKGPKKVELEEKWKQYRVEELKLYVKRLQLLTEQGYLVLAAMESSNSD